MPIAVEMASDPRAGAASPASASRMTKAAFFRARSPPIADRVNGFSSRNGASGPAEGYGNVNDLSARLEASLQVAPRPPANGSQAGSSGPSHASVEDDTVTPPISAESQYTHAASPELEIPPVHHQPAGYFDASPATDGHAPTLDRLNNPPGRGPSPVRRRSTVQSQRSQRSTAHIPVTPRNRPAEPITLAPAHEYGSTMGHGSEAGHETYESSHVPKDSPMTGFAGGSDEMLLTLLAGQAAVDCENLPIGRWEEVEAWKKELTLISNRLEACQARHQREVKIHTAAKTLQKLNNSNKRMSRQTMESLEQAEKRVGAAEREVYVLQDREAGLRRQLMEHWSGAMAWEVRRLEQAYAETQSRHERQSMQINTLRDREAELLRQVAERDARIQELEEMVIEMGRRERAIEEEARELNDQRLRLEGERRGWNAERDVYQHERDTWTAEKRSWDKERQGWDTEQRRWAEERAGLLSQQREMAASGQMSEKDRAVMDQIRLGLGGILGKKMGSVGEGEILPALEELKVLVGRREKELVDFKEEMREVHMGLEAELKRVAEDRDVWRKRTEQGESGRQDAVVALEKRSRNQQDQIEDLSLLNESLASSLKAAQNAVASMSPDTSASKALQVQVDGLTSELDAIASQFNSIWTMLPPTSRRVRANLLDPRTGQTNGSLASPSQPLDFAAMQELYKPHGEQVGDIGETLKRIRGVIEDSKVLVERTVRMGQERELLKGNAARAKKLVEESAKSLETYQQQVAVLEDRLAKSGTTESHFLNELNDLQSALDNANSTKRTMEAQLTAQLATCARLTEANDSLSARALDMAQSAQEEKTGLTAKLSTEIEELRRKLRACEEDADEERAKSQGQRIQLLDELNSLQAEVGDLRKQLRAKV
ncbi:hypothetical protein IAU60_000804 [Kwoniella sp. DSM 27419]